MLLSLSIWPTGMLRQFHDKQYRGGKKRKKKDASEEIWCVIGALATVLFSALREPAEASLAGKTLGGTLPH